MIQRLMNIMQINDQLEGGQTKNLIFLFSVAWVALMLGVWNFALIFSLDSGYLLPLFFDLDALSNVASWQYLSNKIMAGDLLLLQKETGFQVHDALLPRLGLLFSAAVSGFLGHAAALFIFTVVLPTICYVYLVRIYRLFLPLRWSIFIAALGLLSMANYPFRNFLIGLIAGDVFPTLPVLDQPDIIGQPFPSLSLLIFLLLFYYSILSTRTGGSGQMLISVLWGLQGYIHILNLAFGIPFWLIVLGLFYWRRTRHAGGSGPVPTLLKSFAPHFVVVCLLSLPVLYGVVMTEANPFVMHETDFDWFTIVTYMMLPLLLLALCFIAFRIDPYELVIKFNLVWITMLVELFLLICWAVFGFGISSDVMDARLGLYFLHLFYYVPAIYYAHRPYTGYYSGSEATLFAIYFRKIFSFFFHRLSLVYLPLFCALLSVFVFMGSNAVRDNFERHIKADYETTHAAIVHAASSSQPARPASSAAEALFRMINGADESWTNSFVDPVNIDEAIEGFAHYAHLHSWTLPQFKAFMLPRDSFESDLPYEIYDNIALRGLGYWLLTNSQTLDMSRYNDFQTLIEQHYNSVERQITEQGKAE